MWKIVIFLFAFSTAFGFVGKLTEVTGPTQVSRTSGKLEGKINTGIEMEDMVETLNSRAGITFDDGTRVQCTEHSKLIIDTFVYDPNSKTGKISLKASMGTVRYASGLIAKNSKEDVKVKTPTASISVRGTDFSMTVDELGRSLVILLPSLPQFGIPVVGSIVVDNGMGEVTLTKAYQATVVSSMAIAPAPPFLLDLTDESGINNMMLLDPPSALPDSGDGVKKTTSTEANGDKEESSSGKKKSGLAKIKYRKSTKKTNADSSAPVDDISGVTVETASTAVSQQEDQSQDEEEAVTILDINAIRPEVNSAIMAAVTNPAKSDGMMSIDSVAATSNGFVVDGNRAILSVTGNNSVVWYSVKPDINMTLTINNREGQTVYPLNFGGKLKVNITQK